MFLSRTNEVLGARPRVAREIAGQAGSPGTCVANASDGELSERLDCWRQMFRPRETCLNFMNSGSRFLQAKNFSRGSAGREEVVVAPGGATFHLSDRNW